jgi:hypothetical protein
MINELVLVSKQSILKKHFGIDMDEFNKLSEKEKEEVKKVFPTEEEIKFMEIFKSDMPQLARLQRKMSVCLEVEVSYYDFENIEFNYSGSVYKLLAPKNAYRICKALEKDSLEGLQDLCKQGCVLKDNQNVNDIKENSLQVDEIQILKLVADKFFFQTFLV